MELAQSIKGRHYGVVLTLSRKGRREVEPQVKYEEDIKEIYSYIREEK